MENSFNLEISYSNVTVLFTAHEINTFFLKPVRLRERHTHNDEGKVNIEMDDGLVDGGGSDLDFFYYFLR